MAILPILRRASLAMAIFGLLGIFQVIILTVPFGIYARQLSKVLPNSASGKLQNKYPPRNDFANITYDNLSRTQLGYALLIGRWVTRISRYTPWPNKCLVQALLTKFLLRRFNIANTLIIGVGFEDDGKFKAHAWVNVSYATPLTPILDNDDFHDTARGQVLTIVGGAMSHQEFKTIKTFRDYYAALK